MNWKRPSTRIAAALLALGVTLFLLTGSPIPLWHIESLNHPVQVKAVSETHFELEGGSHLAVPYLVKLPANSELFRVAAAYGVEVQEDGRVFGLMWLDRNCGNDLVVWRRKRVDLTELGAAIDPTCLDPAQIHPDNIAFLRENYCILQYPSHSHVHLNVYDFSSMRHVREIITYAQEHPETQRTASE